MTGAVEAVATAEGLPLGETVRVLVDLDFALRDAGADRDALVERDTDRHEAVSWSGEENVEALAVGVWSHSSRCSDASTWRALDGTWN